MVALFGSVAQYIGGWVQGIPVVSVLETADLATGQHRFIFGQGQLNHADFMR
jgi:hypothetical protein